MDKVKGKERKEKAGTSVFSHGYAKSIRHFLPIAVWPWGWWKWLLEFSTCFHRWIVDEVKE